LVGRKLCLIPAKGGSTRLARKNVLPLGGRPLLGWTIDAAKTSDRFDRIIVSTEDEGIVEIARQLGAEVPFLRPMHLARDPAGVVEVALHALTTLRSQGEEFQTLVILLPTCPFRTASDIRDAIALFDANGAHFLMSVSKYEHTPFAALNLVDNLHLEAHFPQYIGKKSQEMPVAFRANGAIHVLDVNAFEEARSYYAQPLIGYEMPWERSIDIDTAHDLRLAESLIRQHN
jgi:CMP-N,N'-diacetyllegionaminic acid synthase